MDAVTSNNIGDWHGARACDAYAAGRLRDFRRHTKLADHFWAQAQKQPTPKE